MHQYLCTHSYMCAYKHTYTPSLNSTWPAPVYSWPGELLYPSAACLCPDWVPPPSTHLPGPGQLPCPPVCL